MRTIILVNTNTIWGGGEKWHFNAANFLRKHGYNVIVFCSMGSPLWAKIKKHNFLFKTIKISNLSFLNLFKLYNIYKWIRQYQPYAVIITLPSDLKAFAPICKLSGVKRIIYRRGVSNQLRSFWLNKLLFKYVIDIVVANSQTVAESLYNNNSWFPKNKIYIIKNGLMIDYREDVQPLYHKISQDEIVIGNASRLIESKNHIFLIDLVRELKNLNIKIKLLIAGDGPLRDTLENQVRSLNLCNEVMFLGYLDGLHSFFKSIDFFILPSVMEGHSNVLLEAMAHKVVVICADIPANREIVIHEQTGILFKIDNVLELAYTIKNLYLDQHKIRQMIFNAFLQIQNEFEFNKVFNKWLQIINGESI